MDLNLNLMQKGSGEDQFGENTRRKETIGDEVVRSIGLRESARMSGEYIARADNVEFCTCQCMYSRAKRNRTPAT